MTIPWVLLAAAADLVFTMLLSAINLAIVQVGDSALQRRLERGGRAAADQLHDARQIGHALVGDHWRIDPGRDVDHPVDIPGPHRLLDLVEADARVFKLVQGPHGLLGAPALVDIEPEQGPPVDRRMHRLDPLHVHARILAHLDLQGLEAPVEGGQRVGDHLVDVVDADRDVGRDRRITPAQ